MSNLSSLTYYIPELIIISAILLVIVLDVIPACTLALYYWQVFSSGRVMVNLMVCLWG